MPIDQKGFIKQQDPSRSQIEQRLFKIWHVHIGYRLRRYSPSLTKLSILLAILRYADSYQQYSWLIQFYVLLVLLRFKLYHNPEVAVHDVSNLVRIVKPCLYFILTYTTLAIMANLYMIVSHFRALDLMISTFVISISTVAVYLHLRTQRGVEDGAHFSYDGRKLGDGEFRLLKIHKRLPFKRLRTSLYSYPINKAPKYEAISYRWASPSKTHIIVVDGHSLLQTTASTYNALNACSRIWSSRLVWIDFVCINQNDEDEKSVQVGFMKDIYSNASQVIIWLAGPPYQEKIWGFLERMTNMHDTAVAVDFLEELANLATFSGLSAGELAQVISRERETHRVYRWDALVDLLGNPWFSRTWVIQEVSAAVKARFIYGNEEISWRDMVTVLMAFQEPETRALLIRLRDKAAQNGLDHFHKMKRLQGDFRALKNWREREERDGINDSKMPSPLPLSFLLAACSKFEATDARDKVYALLGLMSDPIPRSLQPNYKNSTPTEVFRSTARHLLSNHDPFNCLSYGGIGYRYSKTLQNLPSWAPDWTTPRTATTLHEPLYNYFEQVRYRASRYSTPNITLQSDDMNTAVFEGLLVDEIIRLGDVLVVNDLNEEIDGNDSRADNKGTRINAALLSWHDQALQLAEQHTPDTSHRGLPREETFWRTLIGDTSFTSRPAPIVLASDYNMWVMKLRVHQILEAMNGNMSGTPPDLVDLLNAQQDAIVSWGTALGLCAHGRRFAVTKRGFMGMVPPFTQEGDLVSILAGGPTPFVLRRVEEDDEIYELVGECYVDGMMDGEEWATRSEGHQLKLI